MKYRLGDICTITKGATGIMKAVPGPFPMVTLGEERKLHNEYQFDAAAVIVPLISSTGHGHASIKRIHYQEGKFALGTILCAVIPKDETLLNPRYLFVYLQQFKDSVLVPLMKGAANVSLPLNKLASLEIEVPVLAKQKEIIDLAHILTEHKSNLDTLLNAQEADTIKLRQALLREAMQGQLLPQDPTDEPAAVLLQKLQAEKANLGKGSKRKVGSLFAQEAEAVEGPFEIPESWVWCKLEDLSILITDGTHQTPSYTEQGRPFLSAQNVKPFRFMPEVYRCVSEEAYQEYTRIKKAEFGDLLIARVGAGIGECAVIDQKVDFAFYVSLGLVKPVPILISSTFLSYWINGPYGVTYSKGNIASKGSSAGNFNLERIRNFPIPLPPLAEQHLIVAKLEQLMQHCEALEQRIRENRRLAEQLLQTALREALAPPTGLAPSAAEPELAEAEASPAAPQRGRPS